MNKKIDSTDRRSHRRLPVRLLINYETKEVFRSDYITDISGGGLFIQTQAPLPIGTEMELKIAFPNIPKLIIVRGIVIWINEYSIGNKSPGMGIRFIELKEEDARFIEDLTLPQN